VQTLVSLVSADVVLEMPPVGAWSRPAVLTVLAPEPEAQL